MISALLLGKVHQLWFSVPLLVAVSLTYAATRHELMIPILKHAVRLATWIVVFMAASFAILQYISSLL